jgi:hypothetical protein
MTVTNRVIQYGVLSITVAAFTHLSGCTAFQAGYQDAEYERSLKELGYTPVAEGAIPSLWPGTIITQGSHLSKSGDTLLVCKSSDLLIAPPTYGTLQDSSLRKHLSKRLITNKLFTKDLPSEPAIHALNLYDESFKYVSANLGPIEEYTEDLAALIASREQLNPECVGAIKHLGASGENLFVVLRILVANVNYSLRYAPKAETQKPESTTEVLKELGSKLPIGSSVKLELDGSITVKVTTAVGYAAVPLKSLGWDLK